MLDLRMDPSILDMLFLNILLFLTNFAASFVDGLPSNVIDTGYAKYLGNRTFPNTVAYLGIPYAEPPLGDRRFRAPLPLNTTRIAVEAAGAVIDATKYPDFCVQGAIGQDDGGAGSEDCLKLNIYAPAGAKKGSNLSVLVYIHGGGYVFGNPGTWPLDAWINQSPNVVIVSVYYRLDSLGFLSHPDFADPKNGDFNAGFLDQVQSLRWVKEHISAFGGNPNKVTINGESAGGGSITLHLVADLGKERLFSGAIAQSVYRVPMATPEQKLPSFNFYAAQAGCGSGETATQLACLRSASISTLARAQDATAHTLTGSYRLFVPCLDGKVFTLPPTVSILEGKYANVPLIVGATSNETVTGGTDIASALKTTYPALTDDDIAGFLQTYPASDFSSASQQFQVCTGEAGLICARNILAPIFAKTSKSFTYRYNQANPTTANPNVVAHAAENWMMFLGTNPGTNGTTTFSPMTPVETAFAEELIAYWLSFVRAEDPNTFKLARSPIWPAYASTKKTRIVLQQDPLNTTTKSGSFLELEPERETERCNFVASKAVDLQD
ncbi:Alpha/Beta hydrolase protein [Mycena floridula]|nr:Alpha/Beta hydrolase protein [Mycena floridula]